MGAGGIGSILTQGGVPLSGPQQALADYTKGQGEVAGSTAFQGGPSLSTNETMQAGVAPGFAGANVAGEESLANTRALQNFFNTQSSQLFGGLGNILGKAGGSGGGGGTGGISSLPPEGGVQ